MPRASKAGAAKTSKVKATMAKAVNAIKGKKKAAATAKAAAPPPAPAKAAPAAKKATAAPAPAPAKAAAKAAKAAKAPAKTAQAPAKKAAAPAKAVKKAAPAPKKQAAKQAAPAQQATPAKTAPAKKQAAKAAPAPKTPAKAVDKTAPAAKAPAPKKEAPATVAATKKAAGKPVVLDKFLLEQQALLLAERRDYEQQAAALKAEADSLAQEMEPGDIQFDEESGEGGTMNIDRERDLALSAQARAAVDEIDHALAKIEAGTYGDCERCGQPIPKARLKALPYARLCVACKSGGLSRR